MAWLLHGKTITDAWLAALEYLATHERAMFDLLVEITEPSPESADQAVIAELDAFLGRRRCYRVNTVVNTIFPVQLASTSPDRATLYTRYRQLLPRLRGLPKNKRGLYFEPLIDFPLGLDAGPLTVHAFHAAIDPEVGVRATRALIRA